MEKSKLYKENKYQKINDFKTGIITGHELVLTTWEVSVLGFTQYDSSIFHQFSIPVFDEHIINKMSKTAIQLSFDIYSHRDSGNE